MTHERFDRRGGLLVHPTSLPGPHGAGDLGPATLRFLDWLQSTGLRAWQVLPLVPPGAGDSPYSSWSAFAGSPWLIDLFDLRDLGLLDDGDVEGGPAGDPDRVDFGAMQAFKAPRLQKAADRLRAAGPRHRLADDFATFRAAEAGWLEDTALFWAIKQQQGGAAWWTWPVGLRDRAPKALAEARAALDDTVERTVVLQFLFQRQWDRVRAACAQRELVIIGDLPIYVDADSADVWAHRRLFALDAQGQRTEVAGVPPDAFSATGQLWGNPLYRWDVMAKDGYRWWVERLRRALSLHDRVRIDHFRAFANYWAVPADAEDAQGGRWVDGPGVDFFAAMRDALGALPILAEDLGLIDQPVRDLLEAVGLPGMKVLQFAFGGEADNEYLPHHHVPHSVVYTGTHDNDTTLGWWLAAPPHVQDHVRHYFGISGHDLVWDFVRACLASVADTAVVPLQDVLCLDGAARMNTPAVAGGNWSWRARPDAFREDIAGRVKMLVGLYDR